MSMNLHHIYFNRAFRNKTSITKPTLDPHLYMMQIETWCYYQGEERISIIKSWGQERHPVNENKQNCYITGCHFDNWEPSNTASVW